MIAPISSLRWNKIAEELYTAELTVLFHPLDSSEPDLSRLHVYVSKAHTRSRRGVV